LDTRRDEKLRKTWRKRGLRGEGGLKLSIKIPLDYNLS
jgi:hypothetical protein